MKNKAIIPARGGSKRIPRKNIRPFLGKPVIAYSIAAALQSGLFDEVMVSTDDEEIAEVARQYGAKVPFMRSATTADDYATTADVMLEVLECYKKQRIEYDTLCCIYSTAPFVTADSLKSAYHLLAEKEFDSVFTAVAYSYPVQRGLKMDAGKIRMVWPEYSKSRSQDLETIYHDAGQFYVSKVGSFYRHAGFRGPNTGGIILSELEVQDLDTETDWQLAEMKYRLLHP